MNPNLEAALIIFFSLLFIVALTLGFTYFTYFMAFKRRKKKVNIEKDLGIKISGYDKILDSSEELKRLPYERVEIKSHDGLTLVGRYYHVLDGAPVDILVHGYRSSPTHDFGCGISSHFEMKHNCLLVYQRAIGKSEGRSITFGHKEKLDLLSWCEYVIKRFGEDVEITLAGISMGAATVILASALDLPTNVKYAIADCPYSSAKEEICLTVRGMHLPPPLVWPFIRLGGILFARFDPECVSVAEAASKSKIPILLIHGEADSFVPKYMSDKIYAANTGTMYYHTFPSADHGLSYVVDPERYKELTNGMAEKYLKHSIRKK